jgi:hypothetical protein
LIQKSPA